MDPNIIRSMVSVGKMMCLLKVTLLFAKQGREPYDNGNMRRCGPTLEPLESTPYLAVSLSTKKEEGRHEYGIKIQLGRIKWADVSL